MKTMFYSVPLEKECLLIDKFCKILAERGKNSVGMTNSIIKFKLKFIASPAAVKACAA